MMFSIISIYKICNLAPKDNNRLAPCFSVSSVIGNRLNLSGNPGKGAQIGHYEYGHTGHQKKRIHL